MINRINKDTINDKNIFIFNNTVFASKLKNLYIFIYKSYNIKTNNFLSLHSFISNNSLLKKHRLSYKYFYKKRSNM